MKKKIIGIVLSGLIMGICAGSILAYPAGVVKAVSNPWEAVQYTTYKITGQEEKAAEIEERIETVQSTVEQLNEVF